MHILSTEKTTHLALGDKTVDDIFAGFEPGDFTVLHGNAATFMSFVLCVRCQMPTWKGGFNSSAVFLDGGNTFNPYAIAEIARRYDIDSHEALEKIHVSRAFTAYQLSTLVLEKLEAFLKRKHSKLLMVSDISSLFFDKDMPKTESRDLFMKVCAKLADIAAQKQTVVAVTYFPERRSELGIFFDTMLFSRLNVLIGFNRNGRTLSLALEDHSRIKLFSMDFGEDYMPLATFVEA